MGKLRALILASLFLSFPIALRANAQTASQQLERGIPVERQLADGHVHEFTVSLEENSFVQLVVEQRGIDVIVKVFNPKGRSLGDFDTPNGANGPEHVSFVGATAGAYRISVGPLDPLNASEGRYQIKVLEVREATEQDLKASKNLEVVKARGIALLEDIEGLIPQIKSPLTRIRAQLMSAQLLWETDEKRASKFLSDAVTGFKEYIATLDPSTPNYQRFANLGQLRYEMVYHLAARDPDTALAFLYSTSQVSDLSGNKHERSAQESALELAIADQVSKKDPARALQIAKRSLKSRLSADLINTLHHLRRQNPEMAAELAAEVASKLLTQKLVSSPEIANLAVSLIRLALQSERRFQSAPANESKQKVALLRDEQQKELLQKMLTEALSYSPPQGQQYLLGKEAAWYLLKGLSAISPAVESVMTGGPAAVQKKMRQMSEQPFLDVTQQFEKQIANGSANASLEVIEKAPSEIKEQLYIYLANREASNGDFASARQIINEHISNPNQRRQALSNLDHQELERAMNTGKIEEALRTIGAIRNSRERGVKLAQIIHQIGPGQKRAQALNYLEQARSLLGPSLQAQDQDQMNALFELVRAFSRYDSKRAFEILDPLIDQFNDLAAAARTLEGFGPEYYDEDELDLSNGSSVSMIGHQLSTVLGTIALTSFDGAKAGADRVRPPEVRLRIYLEIASQTIKEGSTGPIGPMSQ